MSFPPVKAVIRGRVAPYALALAVMALAFSLRVLMDPWLGDNMIFLTIYGVVPCTVWFAGWRAASLASLLGFLVCVFWFVPPHGTLALASPLVWGASSGYWITSSLIIFLGHAAQTARRRAEAHSRTLEILNQTCITLSGELDLEKLLQAITDAGREVSGAAFGAFFYNAKDERGESYMLFTLSGAPRAAFEGFPMPRNTALFSATFGGGKVVRIGDVLKDARYGKSAPHHGMPPGHLPVRSYLAASVVAPSGEVIGGLFYGHPEPDMFSEDIEEILSGIAAQAAIAIEKARLYKEAQAEITTRRENEAALRVAKGEAEIANAAKDRFLAMMSHELRTPLNPALMLVSAHAQSPATPEELRQDLDMVRRSLALEARLIDDLLDVSKVVQGRLELEIAKHDLNRLIRQGWAVIGSELAASSVKVEFQLHPQDLTLPCDPVRIQQVLWCLLRNGASHTEANGVLTVSSQRGEGTVKLIVRDSGVGIQASELESIFEAFEQSTTSRRSGHIKSPGLGLGLAICRGIVTAHGGKIWAESEGLGQGATFTVELPAAEA
ncbi:MAG: ATP-binding protein [Verrucomicrobiota bacterium]